jgi:hypothetical protein
MQHFSHILNLQVVLEKFFMFNLSTSMMEAVKY